jgi:capsular polysaccharide biosynthesis protein
MRKLEINRFERGIILPYKRDPKGTTGLGGVIDNEGNFTECSYCHGGKFEHGGPYEWSQEDLKTSDEKVVYFGYFLPHWGHFLVDCLGRMWPFVSQAECLNEYKLAFVSQVSEFYPNCYEFFQSLGIEKNRIIHVSQPTQFAEVLVPDMSYTPLPNRVFYPEFVSVFNHVAQSTLAAHSIEEVTGKWGNIDKVYLTRSSFNGAKSREVGLKIIDKVFKNGGYTIIPPEQLSLTEQILIWNHSEAISCINGTIPLNVIFCVGGVK